MRNWPKVGIVVLNWNGWRDTIECLESLQHLSYPNYQIIVVDNGSTDGSLDRIKGWAWGELSIESSFLKYDSAAKPVHCLEYDRQAAEAGGTATHEARLASLPPGRRIVLIQTGENLGFSEGCNVGIRYALGTDAQYALLWNNDAITTDAGAVEKLVDVAESGASIGIVGAKICYYSDPATVWYAGGHISRIGVGVGYVFLGKDQPDDGRFDSDGPVGFVTGCFMLVKRQVLELVGLLDGRLFFGAEDADFCLRAREQGFQMYYAPQVTVYHKVARTYDRYDPQMLQHMYSGKILFVKKHSSRWGWRLWRVAFLCYMLLIGIPRLSLMSYRSTGHARIVPIAQRLLAAYREHALM